MDPEKLHKELAQNTSEDSSERPRNTNTGKMSGAKLSFSKWFGVKTEKVRKIKREIIIWLISLAAICLVAAVISLIMEKQLTAGRIVQLERQLQAVIKEKREVELIIKEIAGQLEGFPKLTEHLTNLFEKKQLDAAIEETRGIKDKPKGTVQQLEKTAVLKKEKLERPLLATKTRRWLDFFKQSTFLMTVVSVSIIAVLLLYLYRFAGRLRTCLARKKGLDQFKRLEDVSLTLLGGLLLKGFEKMGYQVSEAICLAGGCLTCVLERENEKALFQYVICKDDASDCGRALIEQFTRTMEKENADKGYLVTTGTVAEPVFALAKENSIELVGKEKLEQIMLSCLLQEDLLERLRDIDVELAKQTLILEDEMAEKEALSDKLIKSHDIIAKLNDEQATLGEKVKTREEEYGRLLKKEEDIKKELQDQKEEISNLVLERNNLQEKNRQLEDKNRNVEEQIAKYKSMEKELSEKSKLMEEERELRQQIKEKYEHLKKELEKYEHNMSELLSERDGLREDNSQLQDRLQNLDEQLANYKNLEKQLSQKDKFLEDERSQRQHLEDAVLQSDKDLDEAMYPTDELEEQLAPNEQVVSEIEATQRGLSEDRTLRDTVSEELEKVKANNQALQKTLAEKERVISSFNEGEEELLELLTKAWLAIELRHQLSPAEGEPEKQPPTGTIQLTEPLAEKEDALKEVKTENELITELQDDVRSYVSGMEEVLFPSLDLRPLGAKGVLLKLEPKGPVATLKSIAISGISFESEEKLEIPSPCNISLIFFGSFSPLTVRSSLLWQKKIPGTSMYNARFKFLSLNKSQSRRINEYINRTRKELSEVDK